MSQVVGKVKACVKKARQKTQRVEVGRMVQDEDGNLSIVLDRLPLHMHEFTGWLNIYPLEDRAAPTGFAPQSDVDEDEDDIPF